MTQQRNNNPMEDSITTPLNEVEGSIRHAKLLIP